jgi:hypothetical protein
MIEITGARELKALSDLGAPSRTKNPAVVLLRQADADQLGKEFSSAAKHKQNK